MRALITADDLATALARDEVRVLDVQWSLTGTPGAELYAAGHLPDAPFLDLDTALSGPPGPGGRHPLPDPQVLEDALRACGVCSGDEVVVYDQRTSLSAARAWWVLRWAGHAAVRVLDGGLAAWQRAGGPVTREVPSPPRGEISVRPGSLPVLDAAGAADMARHGVLLDVRAGDRYRGEHEPLDPVGGHVPGSLNLPMAEMLAADGTFLPPERIRERAAAAGVHRDTAVGTSCGSGVTAAQMALALDTVRIAAVPYVGSWSEWVADPARPVATGADPG
ncbi:sulfurtransferase [Phycicoccus endophyticus]|uniref:Sulfurtransferase n=1 Tax=Phycicoccus endophyticus TaxID=1690220 RepID=A0A7G9R3X5_9MICO|nr:sulfurtransferase [Phycicoccus endophyticus]NHI18134.1 sulfurtransferase [Phycicoccus endophyticus]QNN50300.1 sulfurtransferase [Phycicoccus endophyticus]GGL26179.1 sulfurtransferase [Phycicoccus endophyticus]